MARGCFGPLSDCSVCHATLDQPRSEGRRMAAAGRQANVSDVATPARRHSDGHGTAMEV